MLKNDSSVNKKNVYIGAKLSKIDVWNKKRQLQEEIYFSRDDFINVLEYCDYSRLFNVITKFPSFSPNMLNN